MIDHLGLQLTLGEMMVGVVRLDSAIYIHVRIPMVFEFANR